MAAHAAFDPIWRDAGTKRSAAYAWLAAAMGIPTESCHIGMMDVDDCLRVVELCKNKSEARAKGGEGEG